MVSCKCGKTSVDDEEWYSRYIGKPKLLQQSDKLKELFPNYVGNPSIEIYEDGDSSKVVTYLNVPENRIEILYSNWDESSGQWIGDIDGTTLDDVDDTEFEILIKGIINQSKDD